MSIISNEIDSLFSTLLDQLPEPTDTPVLYRQYGTINYKNEAMNMNMDLESYTQKIKYEWKKGNLQVISNMNHVWKKYKEERRY